MKRERTPTSSSPSQDYDSGAASENGLSLAANIAKNNKQRVNVSMFASPKELGTLYVVNNVVEAFLSNNFVHYFAPLPALAPLCKCILNF